MARCGIRLRYPVIVAAIGDEGERVGPVITVGEAETLPLALKVAERSGFTVREDESDGAGRFVPGTHPCFLVCVYPD